MVHAGSIVLVVHVKSDDVARDRDKLVDELAPRTSSER